MAPVHRHARAQGVLVATILGVALSGCSLVGASEKPESIHFLRGGQGEATTYPSER